MRSDQMKAGIMRIPHRSLFKATGLTDEELQRPIVGIVNAQNDIILGHVHLGQIVDAVKAGVRMAGGTLLAFSAIGICDGIAMGHDGIVIPSSAVSISRIPLKSWLWRTLLMRWFLCPTATKSFPVC
jgi:dihydroxyacid dehydratase/phosphogluconate dehydratase